jgi:uncharacterized membrane protein HdeD (DUF308 family)
MDPTQTSGNGTPTHDAVRAISIYLTEHSRMTENEAREEAQVMLRGAAPIVGGIEQLMRPWWTLLLRGLLAIAVGILFLRQPARAVTALVLVFGAWVFVDGIMSLASSVSITKSWSLAIAGLIGIVVGATAFVRPGIGLVVFYTLVAIWAMSRGISEIGWGVHHRHEDDGESRGGLIALGVISFAFGLFLLIAPTLGLTVLAAWIGIYALVFGFALVVSAFPLRRAQHRLTELTAR